VLLIHKIHKKLLQEKNALFGKNLKKQIFFFLTFLL
jgi:hypothetical protein